MNGPAARPRLDSRTMARFAARGFLLFEGIVPDEINRAFLDGLGDASVREGEGIAEAYGRFMAGSRIPVVPAGVPLSEAIEGGSPLGRLLAVPRVRGLIDSLVGPDPVFDHHFLHLAFPTRAYADPSRQTSQVLHQDSTIDPRRGAFDVQLFYFPHAVGAEDGGTRYVPGSHLRIVSEAAIARYQNVLGQRHVTCPAGSLLVAHHGLWHGGGCNRGEGPRFMYKIRLNPTVPQVRLWDVSDLPPVDAPQRPIFWAPGGADPESVDGILMRPEPWWEDDTGRLELMARVRFWRQLTGEPERDVDHWLRRVENVPG